MRFRFTLRELLLVTAIVALALAWWVDHHRLRLQLTGYGGPLSAGAGYDKCTTLDQAVQLAQGQMTQDGKRVYAALLSEGGVKAAMHTAIESVSAKLDEEERHSAGFKEYWQNTIRPICQEIIDTGRWPTNCSFEGFYGLSDGNGLTYDGVGLRLVIKTPHAKFDGYSLPILDLFYGRGGG